jgi:tetratricopeptide (TPR) repeat protein
MLNCVLNLLLVLLRQGKYEEAEQLNRRALAGYEKVLGVDHPTTLTSLHNLAYVLHNMKLDDRAVELY